LNVLHDIKAVKQTWGGNQGSTLPEEPIHTMIMMVTIPKGAKAFRQGLPEGPTFLLHFSCCDLVFLKL
jgi:hypothetical protein